jgi:hypothetical protein
MMLDIPPHIENFLSSQEMDDLETQERLLFFGNKLQKSLEEHSGDEICAWMVQYLAEKMEAISSVHDEEKRAAQRECFETILLLWEYRAYFLDETRPFKNFESIFRALAHIDPNKSAPSYFKIDNHDNQPPREIAQAIDLITTLDAATRIMISFFVRESMQHVTDQSSLEWLGAIRGIAKSDEVRIVIRVTPDLDKRDTAQDQNEKRKKELTGHINRLEVFERLSRETRAALNTELKKLEEEH